MTLTLVYRLNGLIGLIWAASMLFGTDMMAASYGWEVTAPMVTMAQFLAMSFFFIAVVFIMLPNWTSEEQLKKATKTLILVQMLAVVMQVYHLTSGAIPSKGMEEYAFYSYSFLLECFKKGSFVPFLLLLKLRRC